MEASQALKNLESNDQNTLREALVFFQDAGTLSHLRPLLNRIKTLTETALKNAAIQVASKILKTQLFQYFNEMDGKTRKSLAMLLKTIDPTIINSIAQDLRAPELETRIQAIRVIGLMSENPRVQEIIIELLSDKQPKVRSTAASLLTEISNAANLDKNLISKLLNDKNPRVVANTLEFVQEIDPERFALLLRRFKAHPNNRVRANTLKALWMSGHVNVWKELQKMVQDQDNALMRPSACWVIGECADVDNFQHIDLLQDCLKDNDEYVRANAIKALQKIDGDATKQILSEHVSPEELEKHQPTF